MGKCSIAPHWPKEAALDGKWKQPTMQKDPVVGVFVLQLDSRQTHYYASTNCYLGRGAR